MIIDVHTKESLYHIDPGKMTSAEYCINVITISKDDDGPWFNLIFEDLNELEMFRNGLDNMIEMWKEYDKG